MLASSDVFLLCLLSFPGIANCERGSQEEFTLRPELEALNQTSEEQTRTTHGKAGSPAMFTVRPALQALIQESEEMPVLDSVFYKKDDLSLRVPPSEQGAFVLKVNVKAGDQAPDFDLLSVNGERVTLQGLLATKPVFLEFGSVTCPMTRKSAPMVRNLKDKYGDSFHFVFVYSLEAHPKGPALHPYIPNDKTLPDMSAADDELAVEEQAATFEQREKAAKGMESHFEGFKDLWDQILVDDFGPEKYNTVWRTYGTSPNPCWVIGKDGIVKLGQWFTGLASAPWIENGNGEKGEAALIKMMAALSKDSATTSEEQPQDDEIVSRCSICPKDQELEPVFYKKEDLSIQFPPDDKGAIPIKVNVLTLTKAPDFDLSSIKGERVTLANLLATKPVFLEFGSATCPMTRKSAPIVRKLKDQYGNSFHFVFVYSLEAHPKGPALHPYIKDANEAPKMSAPDDVLAVEEQAATFEQREKAATGMKSHIEEFEDLWDQILIDDMGPDKYNTAWRTYGASPNPCWVIDKDGIVKLNQVFTALDSPPWTQGERGFAALQEGGEAQLKEAMSSLSNAGGVPAKDSTEQTTPDKSGDAGGAPAKDSTEQTDPERSGERPLVPFQASAILILMVSSHSMCRHL